MQVGCDYILVYNAFITGFSGISQSEKYFSKWSVISDISAASMVFKSYNRSVKQRTVQDNVADETLRFLFGRDIQNAKTFDHLFIGLVIFAEQLIAAADGKHNAVILYIFFEILADLF